MQKHYNLHFKYTNVKPINKVIRFLPRVNVMRLAITELPRILCKNQEEKIFYTDDKIFARSKKKYLSKQVILRLVFQRKITWKRL